MAWLLSAPLGQTVPTVDLGTCTPAIAASVTTSLSTTTVATTTLSSPLPTISSVASANTLTTAITSTTIATATFTSPSLVPELGARSACLGHGGGDGRLEGGDVL